MDGDFSGGGLMGVRVVAAIVVLVECVGLCLLVVVVKAVTVVVAVVVDTQNFSRQLHDQITLHADISLILLSLKPRINTPVRRISS